MSSRKTVGELIILGWRVWRFSWIIGMHGCQPVLPGLAVPVRPSSRYCLDPSPHHSTAGCFNWLIVWSKLLFLFPVSGWQLFYQVNSAVFSLASLVLVCLCTYLFSRWASDLWDIRSKWNFREFKNNSSTVTKIITNILFSSLSRTKYFLIAYNPNICLMKHNVSLFFFLPNILVDHTIILKPHIY